MLSEKLSADVMQNTRAHFLVMLSVELFTSCFNRIVIIFCAHQTLTFS